MSELEFQRELSPEQMREALSLLESAARAEARKSQVGDLSAAAEVDPRNDQAGVTTAVQARLAATEDPQQRKKHLTIAVAFYGLGIAASAAVTLLSWSERALTPSLPGIAREQLPNQPAPEPVESASRALPITNPAPDQSSGGSERRAPSQEAAGAVLVGQASRASDQAAVGDAANSASAIRYSARHATAPAITTMQGWWDERASRKTPEGWWHGRAVRVAAAKSRFWHRHQQPRAAVNSGECFTLVCFFWRNQRAFNYEPPRNVTQ